ncbi:MAG TPA: putative ABC transporter permease [Candidatus Scatosoma pullistercoris]|uniref:ABC transporter permease n=1 Tax=Candidatus Scatosoma pullistercoris TaxID=2840934 RepID=A0A9D1MER6_9FIRM|nr:putative ABC transporter permease [Candidatus Scatosoma pullistercoris]
MQTFLTLTFLFALGAVFGWCMELVYRRLAHGKWVNPGFLHGPYLPLYGFGLVLLYLIAEIPLDGLDKTWLQYAVRLVIICVSMTLIEYLSGLIFIKGMGIKLWDYSSRRGNIQGIICPLFSLIWTLIGGGYVFLLHPAISRAVVWFTGNLYYSFFVGIFFGLFIWDLASTLRLSVKLRKFAKDHDVMVRYEELKLMIRNALDGMKAKSSFLNPFRASAETIRATLARYVENFRNGEYNLKFRKKQQKAEEAQPEKQLSGSAQETGRKGPEAPEKGAEGISDSAAAGVPGTVGEVPDRKTEQGR